MVSKSLGRVLSRVMSKLARTAIPTDHRQPANLLLASRDLPQLALSETKRHFVIVSGVLHLARFGASSRRKAMRKVMSCFGTVGGRCALTILALLVASISLLRFAPGVSAASKGLVFGREVIVDHQRVAGEPSISIDSQYRIYVAEPLCFSTTDSCIAIDRYLIEDR